MPAYGVLVSKLFRTNRVLLPNTVGPSASSFAIFCAWESRALVAESFSLFLRKRERLSIFLGRGMIVQGGKHRLSKFASCAGDPHIHAAPTLSVLPGNNMTSMIQMISIILSAYIALLVTSASAALAESYRHGIASKMDKLVARPIPGSPALAPPFPGLDFTEPILKYGFIDKTGTFVI